MVGNNNNNNNNNMTGNELAIKVLKVYLCVTMVSNILYMYMWTAIEFARAIPLYKSFIACFHSNIS